MGGVLIPAIRFADDQAMVSHTVGGLQVIMDALQVQDTSEKYNMRINTKKTKIMRQTMGNDCNMALSLHHRER